MATQFSPATLAGALLFCTSAVTWGQTPPDAGTLQQQINREREPQLPNRLSPEVSPQPVAMAPMAGTSVSVTEFRFVGNTLLTNEQLGYLLLNYLNRPIDFAQLQAAAAVVSQAYSQAGWVARSYLPVQDIKDGVVTIQIVEALFGGVHIEGHEVTHIQAAQILAVIDSQQKVGEPVSAAALDRGLLLAGDLPGVSVAGALHQGKSPAETDLALQLADKPFWVGQVVSDNTGSRSTGGERLIADVLLQSPLGFGDQIAATAIYTSGSNYLRLGVGVPVGSNGWRVMASASRLDYKLLGSDFDALDAKGSSDSVALEASYPILRSRLQNLYFNFNYDLENFDNQSGGAVTSRYKLNAASIGLTGNLFDSWQGGGTNVASLSVVSGTVDLAGSPNQLADAATTQTNGIYSKYKFSFSRQQLLTDELSLVAKYAGQISNKNLDSSEKFYLGGLTGVRAYPTNEGGGSQGQILNLELRWRLSNGFSVAGFYDYGQVTVNVKNEFAGAAPLNDYSLKGAGLELGWTALSGAQIKAVWARRDGNNPNPTAIGNDQNGTLVKDRFWLSATLPF